MSVQWRAALPGYIELITAVSPREFPRTDIATGSEAVLALGGREMLGCGVPITIREISSQQTLIIRQAILRAGMPIETAQFPGDDLETTQHFGAFLDNGTHVGVASIYKAPMPEVPETPDAWQLRGMATLPEVRGQGAGRALLLACMDAARARGGTLLWCNARTGALEFYRKHGLTVMGEEFEIPTAGPHFRMSIPLEPR